MLGDGPPPTTSVLRSTRLAAYAYTALPTNDPLRVYLRTDYIASLGRHQRLKSVLLPLLRAWRSADIDVLLFKGFQLSEFVYPQPGARFHGDVDILFPPEQIDRAERIAVELGWQSVRSFSWRMWRTHNAFCLGNPRGGTRIDAHSEILHVLLPWYPVQRRITDAVWRDSRILWWKGVDIREPSPVDMLLVALVLQRCWGAEQWELKPHDVVDFRYIASRCGVTREMLWKRAHELRCERTLAAFLERCDPDAGRLDLSPIPTSERRRLNWGAFRERGPLGATELRLRRVMQAPFAMTLALRFVPLVLHVHRALRRHDDPRALLEAVCAHIREDLPEHRRSGLSREVVVAGARWASRLVGSGSYGACLVRALATFVALRERGWPVEFVSGVRRDGGTIVGHAWVELDGGVLLEMENPTVCAAFEQNFRYPGVTPTPSGRVRAPAGSTPSLQAETEPEPQTPLG